MHGRLTSVNVGTPVTTTWRGRAVTSAIWKHPVEGRIGVSGVNLHGDDQADRTVPAGRVAFQRFWLSQPLRERPVRLGLGRVNDAKNRPAALEPLVLLDDPGVASNPALPLPKAGDHRVHVLRSFQSERRDDAAQADSLIFAGEPHCSVRAILGGAEIRIEDRLAYGDWRSSQLRDDTFLTQKQPRSRKSDDESSTPRRPESSLLKDYLRSPAKPREVI